MSVFPSRQVALDVLGFSVHWYGLLYLTAFVLSYVLVCRLQRYRNVSLSKDDVSTVLSYAIVGVIAGGRIGYVLFYEPQYFLQHPLEIVAVWNGGMSSHGGFIGVTLTLLYILRKKQIPLLPFLDAITVPVAIGLALGRFGNFLNWELYGTVTDVPWAIAIPGVEGLRHPTFFYSIAQELITALVCYILLIRNTRPYGTAFAVFLLMYGILRCVVEHYRDQPYTMTDLGFVALTRGQLLSIPIILAGLLLLWLLRKRS